MLLVFGPGEIRRGIEPFGLWPPLVALVGLGGAAGVLAAGQALVRRRSSDGTAAAAAASPATATASPAAAAAPPSGPRGLWIDLLLLAALAAATSVAVRAWVAMANPHGVLLGMDGPSYLRTIIAVLTEQWDHYNTDKRILHAWLAARMGDDPLASAQLLSRVAVSALPALGYLLARTVTGRVEALLVGVLCALQPAAWVFATQSTNYALFFAVAAGSLAALTWALGRPSVARWALAGLSAGLALSTQEKALLTLGPALAVGLPLALLGDRTRARPLAIGVLVGTAVAAAVVVALDPPIAYTPFGSLVVNQREELHREMPWTWASVRQPDPARPTDPPLPDFLRGGELEAALSAVTTPPDSDVLRYRPEQGGWSVAPETSMPPQAERIRLNLRSFEADVPTLPRTSLLLLAIGALGLLLPADRRDPPGGRWVALAPVAALVCVWGPLSLKYNIRYFVHLVPVCALLGVVGVGRLLRLLAGPDRAPRALVSLGAAAFWLLYGQALWVGSDTAWAAPTLPFPSPAASAITAKDPGGNARATLEVARWLAAQAHPGPIVDCAPHPVWLYLHTDPRVTPPDGEHACAAALAAPPPGAWLVASSHAEFRGPATPHPDRLVTSGRWRVVGGWDPQWGVITPASRRWSTGAVVVLEPAG